MSNYSDVIIPSSLINVVEVNKENKNYFIPSKKKINKLTIGDTVQVNNGVERFWVLILVVKKVKGGTLFVGSIINKLLNPDEYDFESKIYFTDKNILNIYDEDYKQWVQEKKFTGKVVMVGSDVNEKK